jgi:hypothetical protein
VVVVAKTKKIIVEEVVEKEAEEEKRNQDEDALNNNTSPMDTNILETLVGVPVNGGHIPVGELGLGLHTPYKRNKVVNLKKLKFNKVTDRIVDLGGYRWPPTFSNWLKKSFWQFWQFTIFSRF